MKRETIGMHTLVEARLTPFGAHVLAEYLNAETARANGQPNRHLKLEGEGAPTRRAVEMPLWELLRVFGPHTVSSARLPFEELGFAREESREERTCREAERGREQASQGLRDLAEAIGIADAYKAPEIVAGLARRYCASPPPRVPNAAGWWWLGEDVVKVTIDGNSELTVRISGRWKPVVEDQDWRGPAIVDHRVRSSEDIPF